MKTSSLWKRWTALALSLVLVLGMLPLSAGAAFSPANYLRNVGYYGNKSKCVMSYDMAQAYADVLKKSKDSNMALLVDVSGDGMPLLLTGYQYDEYEAGNVRIWTWDGTRAKEYAVEKDLENGWGVGYSVGKYQGKPVFQAEDGWRGHDMGDVSPYGAIYYEVKNAQMSILRHEMTYRAFSTDRVTGISSEIPLVKGTMHWVDDPFDPYQMEHASVAEMLKAGWILQPSWDFGLSILYLEKVNDRYLTFDSVSEWEAWIAERDSAYQASVGLYVEGTGSSWIEGDWKSKTSMESALRSYAQAAAAAQGSFLDVPTSNYAYDPVVWAVKKGITNGTSATTFSPDQTCTQGQILTFLWRAVGEPKAAIANPFTNGAVTSNQYYYNALLWAYEQGIVTSKSLNPNAGCQRSDVALYLWRLAGSPAAGGATFSDVSPSAPYAQAVAWAVKEGITNGTSATTFSPGATCTRGQIVTFLYRDLA